MCVCECVCVYALVCVCAWETKRESLCVRVCLLVPLIMLYTADATSVAPAFGDSLKTPSCNFLKIPSSFSAAASAHASPPNVMEGRLPNIGTTVLER